MRMSPTDILDVSGATYTYLINGQPPGANWTALFGPGERVRLRFIIGKPSMPTSKMLIDEPLMKRSRTRSPGRKSAVQLAPGG